MKKRLEAKIFAIRGFSTLRMAGNIKAFAH